MNLGDDRWCPCVGTTSNAGSVWAGRSVLVERRNGYRGLALAAGGRTRRDAKGAAMPVKRPQGNTLVLAVLRSPAHRLLSGTAIELRYTGRRSGRRYLLPVQYAREGNRLVVVPQGAETKTWWRNFLTPQPVSVRLASRLRDGIATVVQPGDPAWEEDRRLYESRWRRLAGRVAGPVVEITLHDR
jgi:hypothetical protein